MKKALFIFALLLSFGCSNYKQISKSNNNDVEVGSLVIKDKFYNEIIQGGAELNLKVFYPDSTTAGASLVIVDNKFRRLVDKHGDINIYLNREDCFSLKIFVLNRLMFSNDELCLDSNTVTKGEIYLEYPKE